MKEWLWWVGMTLSEYFFMLVRVKITVNTEIFVRILFSRIMLKNIFVMIKKNCDRSMIYLHQ